MPAYSNRLPTARIGTALALANIRYWSTVAPLITSELTRWKHHAEAIPDPNLQSIALANLHEEGFNARATATLATLAPRKHRPHVAQAIVGIQLIYDYLDSIIEQPLAEPLAEGRHLYQALIDSVTPKAFTNDNYYAHKPTANDGDYLKKLVSRVRSALAQLPGQTAIEEASERAATRCAEAQTLAHAVSPLDNDQLKRWATHNSSGTGLQWQEHLAGAISSALALHALCAAAGNSHTTKAQALAIDRVYLAISALTTLLDSLIDHDQDVLRTGHIGYTRYYQTEKALADGLKRIISQTTRSARNTTNESHHLMTLIGVAAYYISAPTSSSEFARPVTTQLHRDLQPLMTPTLAIMRVWRTAKALRDRTERQTC